MFDGPKKSGKILFRVSIALLKLVEDHWKEHGWPEDISIARDSLSKVIMEDALDADVS